MTVIVAAADGAEVPSRNNPSRVRTIQRGAELRYGAAHPERRRTAARQNKWRRTLREHGLTESDYELMLAAQGSVCAVCGLPESQQSKTGVTFRLSIDHNHATGLVRGLLCGGCNTAIGKFREDPATMRAAMAYLART